MKPVFSNSFTLTGNPVNGEVVISFKHSYPETTGDAETLVMATCQDDVFSVVLTEHGAKELLRVLGAASEQFEE